VADGFGRLMEYKSEPGDAAAAPARWPSGSRVTRNTDGATLVLFAHPRCPCTRASISELARLLARFPERLSARVVFLRPADAGAEWDETDLVRRAAAIPGATTVRDDDGAEAARFRALTSGAAVLYDRNGRLLFAGGLTASRGHEGDSAGLRRITSLLRTGHADRRDAPVFGCALQTPLARRAAGATRDEETP
jgi:hypothetical protein